MRIDDPHLFARLIADEVVAVLVERGIICVGISSRRLGEKEYETWRDDIKGRESSAHTNTEDVGASSSLMKEVKSILEVMQRGRKQSK